MSNPYEKLKNNAAVAVVLVQLCYKKTIRKGIPSSCQPAYLFGLFLA